MTFMDGFMVVFKALNTPVMGFFCAILILVLIVCVIGALFTTNTNGDGL